MSVCAIKHLTMKASAGVEAQFHSFLILATDGCQWLPLSLGERDQLSISEQEAVWLQNRNGHFGGEIIQVFVRNRTKCLGRRTCIPVNIPSVVLQLLVDRHIILHCILNRW